MTTEEMLLQLIEGQKQMSADISNLKDGQKQMSADISNLKEEQKQLSEGQKQMTKRLDEHYDMIYQLTLNQEKMHNDITSTQADVRSIKLELENWVSTSIKTLCELQLDNSKRLRHLENGMQELNDQLAIGEVLYGLKEKC